jgi:hypothetical protein
VQVRSQVGGLGGFRCRAVLFAIVLIGSFDYLLVLNHCHWIRSPDYSFTSPAAAALAVCCAGCVVTGRQSSVSWPCPSLHSC